MTPEQLKAHNDAILKKAELMKLEPISFMELERIFNKWLLIPDKGILKFLLGFYCANKLERKALWAIVIAPSGGGKTEFLNSLLLLPDIEEISMLTSNTFLSGMPGPADASLLPKLSGKIMLFKDWTTVLSMQKDEKAAIFSQFREIWDGGMKKVFGNGKQREWKGKVSLLAASTQAVDLNQQQYTHLGERFVNYRLEMPDRKAVGMRALANDSDQTLMVHELQKAMFAFFKGINLNNIEKYPDLPMETKIELVGLANFSTMARSGVIRDFGMKKEVIFVPATEMPTRFTQQLSSLATGIMMANKGPLDSGDMKILYKVALDSIPQTNKMVINEMARADGQTTSEIATALGYPTEPIRMYLENLALLKVCIRSKGAGKADTWTMHEDFCDIIRKHEGIEKLAEDQIAVRKEHADFEHGTDNSDLEDAYNEFLL
jgi:hypothetical protein